VKANTSLPLADAAAHFRSIVDATHRYIAYFQFFTAAVVTVVFGTPDLAKLEVGALILGYLVFGILNGRLAYQSQKDANIAWGYLQKASKLLELDSQQVMATRKPGIANSILFMYAVILFLMGSVLVAFVAPSKNMNSEKKLEISIGLH
jgi:hypothetical protein